MFRDPLVIILLLAALLIFFGGRGRISSTMGDFAAGIKNFRKGLKDNDTPEAASTSQLPKEPINVTPEKDKTKA